MLGHHERVLWHRARQVVNLLRMRWCRPLSAANGRTVWRLLVRYWARHVTRLGTQLRGGDAVR